MHKLDCEISKHKLFSIEFWRNKLVVSCLLLSLYFMGSSSYIHAKAILAQYLIEDAWQQSIKTKAQHPPWSWADTYPVAKLSIKEQSYFVLAGATGRTLAFGPGHISSTPLPGQVGNAVIAGHRDTHFSSLAAVNLGEIIKVETTDKITRYQVSDIKIVHEQDMSVMQSNNKATMTLITCYPFDAIPPDPKWRYVITAHLLTKNLV